MDLKGKLRRSLSFFGLAETEEHLAWDRWYAEQLRQLEAGGEIEPPWVAFPNSSSIYGWNQGYPEHWKLNVWLPFWHKLNERQRDDYFERWKPPEPSMSGENWRETLTVYWGRNLSKLKETEINNNL